MKQFVKFLLASCLGTLIALGLLIILLAGLGSAMALTSKGGSGKISGDQILHLKLNNAIPEKTDNVSDATFSFSPKVELGVKDIAETIMHAAGDKRIKGIFLDSGFGSPGQSSSLVIQRALDSFKLSDKWIYAYGDYYTQGSYFLAANADSIFLNPIGNVDFRGFAFFIPFVTEFMDKIGLEFEIYYAGDFKSATEPFRRKEMSEENRTQMREYMEEVYSLYLDRIAAARQLPVPYLRDLADNYKVRHAEDALEYKLVDLVLNREDVYAVMSEKVSGKTDKRPPLLSMEKYYEDVKPSTNFSASDKIAIVYAEGEINDSDEPMNGVIQGDKYAKLLRKIKNDEKVKSVVLRVNSPGGSVLASSKILNELKALKAEGKHLIVSMGDYAASGGYYIAAHADKIYAEPNTLTGSIGVYSMIPALDRMLNDKLGIHFDTLGTGKFATRFTPYFDWDEREDQIMQANTDRQYQKFLEVVSEGRGMTVEEVHAVAQGRIWSGQKAKELGLVDELGDLDVAIQTAKELGGASEYRIVEYPFIKDPWTLLAEQLTGEEDLSSSISKKAINSHLGQLAPYYKMLESIQKEKGVQAKLPFMFTYE